MKATNIEWDVDNKKDVDFSANRNRDSRRNS